MRERACRRDAHGRWRRRARRRHRRPAKRAAGSRRRTIACTCSLLGMADADHGFLDVVGRVFGDREPGFARPPAARSPRAWPSFSAATRVLGDKGLLDRHRVRRVLVDDRADGLDAARPAARPDRRSAVVVTITPLATWLRREPVTSITPQPVRESPGSKPAMRMVVTCPTRESLAPVSARTVRERNWALRRRQLLHQRVATSRNWRRRSGRRRGRRARRAACQRLARLAR